MATPDAVLSRRLVYLLTAYWGHKILCYLGALVLVTVGLALTGAATMLWDITPTASQWVLLVVPSLGLLASAACWFSARADTEHLELEQCIALLEDDQLMLYSGSTEP